MHEVRKWSPPPSSPEPTAAATFNPAGADPVSKRYTVGFDARTTILRLNFGRNINVPLIGDGTDLRINAAFVRPAN